MRSSVPSCPVLSHEPWDTLTDCQTVAWASCPAVPSRVPRAGAPAHAQGPQTENENNPQTPKPHGTTGQRHNPNNGTRLSVPWLTGQHGTAQDHPHA